MDENQDMREPYLADAEWEQWLKERQKTYPLPKPEDFLSDDEWRHCTGE